MYHIIRGPRRSACVRVCAEKAYWEDRGMTETQRELIELVRGVVTGHVSDTFPIADPEELYNIASKHDMAHFVGYAIEAFKLSVPNSEIRERFRQQYYQAIRRVIILEDEISKIKKCFEENSIDFIPLKGAVIRLLYPEKWMRVSADIDILVRSNELEKAEQVLIDRLGFAVTSNGAHHDHVTAPNGFHVDLHFVLSERKAEATPIFTDVWNRSALENGKAHEYQMDDDMFYLFHMFHTAVHFQLGGCGMRPILDTWVLNHKLEFDSERRRTLLLQGGLFRFAEMMERLSEVWFTGTEESGIEDVEDYIFKGGVYGGTQRIAAVQAKDGSRFRYLLKRAFPPAENMMAGRYQIIRHWPVLLPVCWAHRLLTGLFYGKGKQAAYEMKKTKDETDQSREISELFRKMGLS